MVTEGDKVAIRIVLHGTHAGLILGVAPTGRTGKVVGIAVDRVAGAKPAESRLSRDGLSLLRQLRTLR